MGNFVLNEVTGALLEILMSRIFHAESILVGYFLVPWSFFFLFTWTWTVTKNPKSESSWSTAGIFID